jgi:TolB-like protein
MKRLMTVPVLVLMAAAVFGQGLPRLGVLPFTGGSGRDGDAIANLFANSQDLRQGFSIVPRTSSVESMVREQQFQRSGLTDSDTIAELGKQMNADYVVSGHITSFGDMNLLMISIVDVKTMQQVAGDYEEYGRIEAIRGLLPPMAQNIIQSIRTQNESPGPALAVLPLNIQDDTVQQGDAEILSQILATAIANGHKYSVFPRTSTIEAVMAEQQIQSSGLTDRESMIAIGKATNAEFVLAGTITKLGSMNLFDVKILNVESGVQVTGTDREYVNLSDGIELMGELALGVTGAEPERFAETGQSGRNVEQPREAEQRWQAADFQYEAGNNRVTITGYTGTAKDATIPDRINGLPVTTIGTRAFYKKQLIGVSIPNGVTTIGESAFANNQLTHLTIPDSVTAIGNSAFANNRLTHLTIPNSVTTIENSAFANNKLTGVNIPGSVTAIGLMAFTNLFITKYT